MNNVELMLEVNRLSTIEKLQNENKILNDKLEKIEQIVKQVESLHPEIAIGDREGIRKISEVLKDNKDET